MHMKRRKESAYPRDFFLQVLAIVALYASVISGLVLIFNLIEIVVPDPLGIWYSGVLGSIRSSSATLVVFFPVFLLSNIFMQREIAAFPKKAKYKIRKWLLHLTVFLAALVLIGDAVAIVQSFFAGEVTARFLLKVASVALVAGAVFGYIFYEVRMEHTNSSAVRRAFGWGSSAVVVLLIALSFWYAGSPMYQRRVRLDEERVWDLQSLQSQIVLYWNDKGELPDDLHVLADTIRGFMPPRDPVSGGMYGYRATGDLRFELCAVFVEETPELLRGTQKRVRMPYGEALDVWEHGAGEWCFERTIDPERHTYDERKPIPIY